MLITFEGIEGSGKSTQAARVRDWLEEATGRSVVLTREPGGTDLGDRIRALLLEPVHEMAPETELFLLQASRRELCRKVITPALGRGDTVLVDRFGDSSVAYQGYGRGLGPELVRGVVELATGGIRPDVTLVFDIDPRSGLERSRGLAKSERLGRDRDRMESESLSFFSRVREGYLDMAAQERDRFRVIPVTGSVEETFVEVKRILAPLVIPGHHQAR